MLAIAPRGHAPVCCQGWLRQVHGHQCAETKHYSRDMVKEALTTGKGRREFCEEVWRTVTQMEAVQRLETANLMDDAWMLWLKFLAPKAF